MERKISTKPSGWSRVEEDILFQEVEKARTHGVPLKAVFAEVARETGRKPNSIRNHYYLRIKDDDVCISSEQQAAAFVPFSDDEIRTLVRTVLAQQAKGVSVRSCTLKMGNGDNKLMLRFQNKYRSVIKSDPKRVKEIVDEMRAEGINAFDPYSDVPKHNVGRPRKSAENVIDTVSGAVNELKGINKIDVTAFFEGLLILAKSAKEGEETKKKLTELLRTDSTEFIKESEQCAQMREKLKQRENDILMQHERFNSLLKMFRQLVAVNRSFLCMTGVTKMSSLSAYVRELARNVEDCEKMYMKYADGGI